MVFFYQELQSELIRESVTNSKTKPLYISQISIENDSGSVPCSYSFYENLLDSVIKYPLQNVDTASDEFDHIRNNLLFTGLFKDVDVNLAKDKGSCLVNMSLKSLSDDIGLESVIPTSATIRVTPICSDNFLRTTFLTTEDDCSINLGKDWRNMLGVADIEKFESGAVFKHQTKGWIRKYLNGEFSMPFFKNQSFRTILNASVSDETIETKKQVELQFNAGIQKLWLAEKNKPFSQFYTGLSFLKKNLSDIYQGIEKHQSEDFALDAVISKSSLISSYYKDSRDWLGKFPVSGSSIDFKYEYIFFQTGSFLKDSIKNLTKFNTSYEKHVSCFNNKVTTTFLMDSDTDIPMDYTSELKNTGNFWFDRKTTLQDLLSSRSSLNCKFGLVSSFKLPNTPTDSPLRLQLSVIGQNKFKGLTSFMNGYSTDTGISLVYKAKDAKMQLSYKIPLTNAAESGLKNGFLFDVAVTYC